MAVFLRKNVGRKNRNHFQDESEKFKSFELFGGNVIPCNFSLLYLQLLMPTTGRLDFNLMNNESFMYTLIFTD